MRLGYFLVVVWCGRVGVSFAVALSWWFLCDCGVMCCESFLMVV